MVWPATISHHGKQKYNGKLYDVEVPCLEVLQCKSCKDVLFTRKSDEQISKAFRDKLGLYEPEVIKQNRVERGLTQQEFADALSVAVATVSRWETGTVIQSQALNEAMRQYFQRTPPVVIKGRHVSVGSVALLASIPNESAEKVRRFIETCTARALRDAGSEEAQQELADLLYDRRDECAEVFTAVAKALANNSIHVLRSLAIYFDWMQNVKGGSCVLHAGNVPHGVVIRVPKEWQDVRFINAIDYDNVGTTKRGRYPNRLFNKAKRGPMRELFKQDACFGEHFVGFGAPEWTCEEERSTGIEYE